MHRKTIDEVATSRAHRSELRECRLKSIENVLEGAGLRVDHTRANRRAGCREEVDLNPC